MFRQAVMSSFPWPRKRRLTGWTVVAVGIAALLALPLVAILLSLLAPAGDVWLHLWRTQLLVLLGNTVALLLGVGVGTLGVGTLLAFLVVHYRFPGRTVLEWALILPLAIPAYVIGFVFLGLFEFTGPWQTWLRSAFGETVRLPELRSYGGITLMMTLVFYPYVYLLARTALREQGAATLETARSLGRSPWGVFWKVTLPIARPALAAGVALAMMEALADFGTVATFGYRTLTEAIYRVWYGMFDRTAATQLACSLLGFALLLLSIEQFSRGRARYTQTQRRGTGIQPVLLRGWRAWAATAACLGVLLPGFFLPVGQLLLWAVSSWQEGSQTADVGVLFGNTLTFAASAAAITCFLAVVLAYAVRLAPAPAIRFATRGVSLGYALPGSVIAVGVLLPLAWFDHLLSAVARLLALPPPGLLLIGSATGLIFAYTVRFLAISLQTVEASLAGVPASLDDAARSLGATTRRALWRVHLPLIRGGLGTAIILVFVETMKEMPATLLLRPFGRNTLAIEVWQRTSESMWQEAALPALAIVLAGILPVLLTIRLSSKGRHRA